MDQQLQIRAFNPAQRQTWQQELANRGLAELVRVAAGQGLKNNNHEQDPLQLEAALTLLRLGGIKV